MTDMVAISPVRPMAFWRRPIDGVAFPTAGQLAFGVRRLTGKVHQGIDLFAPLGTRVRAPTDGIVVWALNKWRSGFSGYGKVVVIESDQGPHVLLSHLDQVDVKEGDRVHQKQQVGTVGRTAFRRDARTSNFKHSKPHLHLEVSGNAYPMRSDAPRIDPLPFFDPSAPLRVTEPGQTAKRVQTSDMVRPVATVGGLLLIKLGAGVVFK